VVGELPEIKKNAEYIVEITGMTHEGQGVGKIDGFTVFVDGALAGEEARIKVVKINKSYGVGKLQKITRASDSRIEPLCPVYKRCGGCSLQHMDYAAQLKYKTGLVRETVKRIGGIDNAVIHDTIGMEIPLYYRNKAQYPVGITDGETAIGFYAKRSHDIIDNAACSIQDKLSGRVKEIVREFVRENKISVYDENTNQGLLRHEMTRAGFITGEVMVVLVINGSDLPARQRLVEMLTMRITEIKSIFLNINTRRTNIILGDKNIRIYGQDTITDQIGRFKFVISPHSFFQINPVQTELLYGKVLEYAALTGEETVFDLYCGIGTISLFLSQKAGKVYGVEVVEAAVNDAVKNAKLNGVDNVEFITGEAEKVIPGMYEKGARADVVVVDPPRKGCDEKLLETLVEMQPERIVYVSCNPSTLARDLKYLGGKGYRTVEIQPVDMFPWTEHCEAVVRIERVM
jgi:23S rRNA (uracil1939-C5)-methyltransferase